MKVRCEICLETIAEVELDSLRLPLTGGMFGSPDAEHGFPAPFHPSLYWEVMRCPYAPPPSHRPFIDEDAITVFKDGNWAKERIGWKIISSHESITGEGQASILEPLKQEEEQVSVEKPTSPEPRKRGRPRSGEVRKTPLDKILED